MITRKNLRAYKDFQGEVDAYVSTVPADDPERMTDEEWAEIDSLLHEVAVMMAGGTSLGHKERVRRKLKESVASPETLQELMGIIEDARM